MLDPKTIADRMTARATADAAMCLVAEEALAVPGAAVDVFWTTVRRRLDELSPPPVPDYTPVPVRPMSQEEARAFGGIVMPYGQYMRQMIDHIMADPEGRRYLRWLAGMDFIDKLRRYLANQDVAREAESDIPDTDEEL